MFAGVGGFHLGLTQATGFKGVWANEWDKYASAVYRYRFPDTPLSTDDIRAVNPEDLPDFDLLCGGFPCQAFSVAGKRGGFEDTRGTLFFEIARVARAKRPRLLLLENVKGLLNHDGGKTFTVILSALDELGYHVEWQVLNSKHHGVPQNRERIFIIGYLGEAPTGTVFPIGEVSGDAAQPQGEAQGEGSRIRDDDSGLAGALRVGGSGLEDNLIAGTLSHRYGKDGKENLIQVNRENEKHCPTCICEQSEEEVLNSNPEESDDHCPTCTCNKATMIHNVYGGFNEGIRTFEEVSPTIRTPKGGGHLPYVAMRMVRSEKGKEARRENQKKGIDKTPFGFEHRAMEPFKEQVTGAITDALNRDTLLGNKNRIRRLTPVECERLQGFPDGWTSVGVFDGVEKPISDSQRYKMMGNAVTVNVVRFLGKRLLATQTF